MEIQFPLSTSPGIKPNEAEGRLVNCYFDEEINGRRRHRRSPGLTRVADITTQNHCRGLFAVDTVLMIILNARMHTATVSAGVWTTVNRGALDGTVPVTIARNRNTPANIVCVTENGCFNLFTASGPTSFADGDLPGSVNSVAFLNGYFVWTTPSGEIWCSDLNAVTVNPLSFTRAQQRADGLTRGVAFRENYFAFGPGSCEVYRDVGTAPFPLGFVTVIPRGIIGAQAVAGFEDGWANELIWVADDAIVYRLNGYEPARISPPWLSRWIEALSSSERIALRAFVTMAGGHAFWHLSSASWTVVFDHTTGQWHERRSYGSARWRAVASSRFNDAWVLGDQDGGELFTVSETEYRDFDTQIVMSLQSPRTGNFPSRVAIPRADFFVTAGVGISDGEDPVQTDPQGSISWSDDGGAVFGNPVLRPIGAEGEYGRAITILRAGVAGRYGRVWKFEIADPVHGCVQGGAMAIEGRAE